MLRGNVITGCWTGRLSPCTKVRAAPSTTRLDSWIYYKKKVTNKAPVALAVLNLQKLLCLQEISLSEVLQVRGSSQLSVPQLPGYSAHSFELVTASLTYCVVAGDQGPTWETAIRQALMPIQSCSSSSGQGQDGRGGLQTAASAHRWKLWPFLLFSHLKSLTVQCVKFGLVKSSNTDHKTIIKVFVFVCLVFLCFCLPLI